MCGICGVIQIGGSPGPVIDAETLDAMTDALTHRGPNDRGTYVAPGVAIGVRRLSIVDVAGGHQPFASEDGRIVAAQNGEIYNYPDLHTELAGAGHRFGSRCDTEILPHAYEAWGDDYAARLRGIFATVVWDGIRRRAVLARDHLGVKPLYIARAGDLLVFGSELKSVLASGLVDTGLDYEAIDAYLTFGFVPGPRTPLRQVQKLLPGHRLIVESTGVRCEPYWSYPRPQPVSGVPEAELARQLSERIEEAVRLQLMSDVPVGAMLSGGLDSSLIVAFMARQAGTRVKTFSVGFSEDGPGNELRDARRVAALLGTDHYELELSHGDRQLDLERLVRALDEPVADLSSLGFLALSQLASKHVSVALSGQGADELLGGYAKHKAASAVAMMNRLPRPIRALTERAVSYGPARLRRASAVLRARGPVDRLLAMSGRVSPETRALLYRGPLAALDGMAARRAVEDRLAGAADDPLPVTLFLDAQLALVDDMLHYFDRASMAHSLEVRVPFLDHHLVEFCATIPANLKVKRWTSKHLLKEVARPLLPADIVDKRKIGFFAGSVNDWCRAQTRGALDEVLRSPSPRYAEFLDRREVERLMTGRGAVSAGDAGGKLLLSILMLEVWLSTFLRDATPSRRSRAALAS